MPRRSRVGRADLTVNTVLLLCLLVVAPPEADTIVSVRRGDVLQIRDFTGDLRVRTWDRSEVRIEFDEFRVGKRPIYDVSVNYWQIGGLYRFNPTATVRPFFTGTLGFTYFGVGDQLDDDAPRITSDTFFSMVFGGGVKIFASERIALRLAGHLYSTIISSGSGFWCGTGGCGVGLSGWGVWQGDVSAGLTIAM